MMSEALIAGAAYFVFVFFKAFQQRNVAFNHYRWVMPLSYLMSLSEITVIAMIAVTAVGAESLIDMIPMALGVGTGGGIGAMLSMYLHNKLLGDTTP